MAKANIVANVLANIVANIVLRMFWKGVLVIVTLVGANITANVLANIVANIVLRMFWEGVLVVIKLAGANWRETPQQFYPRQQNSLPMFVAKYQHWTHFLSHFNLSLSTMISKRFDGKHVNVESESES